VIERKLEREREREREGARVTKTPVELMKLHILTLLSWEVGSVPAKRMGQGEVGAYAESLLGIQ